MRDPPSWWLLVEILLERRIRKQGQNGIGLGKSISKTEKLCLKGRGLEHN
jgi:hypothetical protein